MSAPSNYDTITYCGETFSGYLSSGSTKWFRFDVNSIQPGDVAINACDSDFDTFIILYKDTDLVSEFDWNDDGNECFNGQASYLEIPYDSSFTGSYYLKLMGKYGTYSGYASGNYQFSFECNGMPTYEPTSDPTHDPTYEPIFEPTYEPTNDDYYYAETSDDDVIPSDIYVPIAFAAGIGTAMFASFGVKRLINTFNEIQQDHAEIMQDPKGLILLILNIIRYIFFSLSPIIFAAITDVWLTVVIAYVITGLYFLSKKFRSNVATPDNNKNGNQAIHSPRPSTPVMINQDQPLSLRSSIQSVPSQSIVVMQNPIQQATPAQVVYVPQQVDPIQAQVQQPGMIQQAPAQYTYQTPEDQAAAKIQAVWRGRQVRQSINYY